MIKADLTKQIEALQGEQADCHLALQAEWTELTEPIEAGWPSWAKLIKPNEAEEADKRSPADGSSSSWKLLRSCVCLHQADVEELYRT